MTSRTTRTALAAALALAAVASFRGAAPALAQEQGPEAEIKALTATVESADDPQTAWSDAMRLVAFGGKAVQSVAEAAASPEATPAGRLALGRVLLALRERPRAAQALLKVAVQSDAPMALRVDAMRLLAQTSDDYEDAIRAVLDGALDSRLRAACAFTLWRLTKDISAKNTLREMVRSDDPEIRIEGSLALAEIGDFGPGVQEVLQQVRVEPTDRGRLAAVLLEKESWDKIAVKDANAAAAGGGDKSDLQKLLDEVLRDLRSVYVSPDEIDAQKLAEGAAHGFVNAVGDPYTTYQDIEERDDWADNLSKKYGGIGAYVGFDQDGIFSITRPMFGGPAWKSNLKAGTRVLRIDEWDTPGHSTDEIVKRLRGPAGTAVKILVQRPGWKDPQEMTLTRATILVPTVTSAMLPGKIGYVSVDNFAQETADEFRRALDGFEKDGAKGLVLDLRYNGGGYLNTAQKMADSLLPPGKLVVETRGPKGEERNGRYVSQGSSTEWGRSVPMTVLVNEFSASASEILSGCLKLNDRAKVVGTRTFGKGSVQNIFYLFTPPFAESFVDRDGNGEWDDAEPWNDVNRNAKWDVGEPYRDSNGNGRWDDAELYTDRNKNGHFDAPAVKITIAKYFVGKKPGTYEFNPHRKEMIVSNRRVWLGGVEPDAPVASEELEGWRAEEMAKLDRANTFERYMGEDGAFFEKNKDTFLRLAQGDSHNLAEWPGFEDLYKSLDTKLSRDEVWVWAHLRLRGHASNALGRPLVGDWAADQQIQRAIRDLMDRPGAEELKATPEYAGIARKAFEVPLTYDPDAIAKARPARSQD
ncbi:MAG: PDZ domain-containing protein [Planctomycetes bacterium]|nr:PDZ domain-containing protein [Planctomycetota bacterium]